jgi:hypothetical protein
LQIEVHCSQHACLLCRLISLYCLVARGGTNGVVEAEMKEWHKFEWHNGLVASNAEPWLTPNFVFSLKIIVSFFQASSSLTAIAETPWPSLYTDVMQYFNFLRMDFVVSRSSCHFCLVMKALCVFVAMEYSAMCRKRFPNEVTGSDCLFVRCLQWISMFD